MNTPRPGSDFYISPTLTPELYANSPIRGSASAAAYVPIPTIRNRIIPTGVSSMISGKPTLNIEVEEDPPERLKPRKISGPRSYAAPVTTIPLYPRGIYYAKRKTILDHIDRLLPTAQYRISENTHMEDNKFYPRQNPNNGSYFHQGFTIDELLAR